MAGSPLDVWGALQAHTENNVGVMTWVNQMSDQAVLPFIVMQDAGFTTNWQFEGEWVDVGSVQFHVFAASVDLARGIAKQIKDLYGPPASADGIQTDGTFRFIEVTRSGYSLTQEDETDAKGDFVSQVRVDFDVKIQGGYG